MFVQGGGVFNTYAWALIWERVFIRAYICRHLFEEIRLIICHVNVIPMF